ncbi:hypothetical protein Btru_073906 [Bulinus truncatus]|nr:hypothetical protein Btru_073906 [Bulinus truncatus]
MYKFYDGDSEKSIPPLESVLSEKQADEVETFKSLIDQVATFEKEVCQRAKTERDKTPFPNPVTDCKPPKICNEYQTARLFLSHYGLLSLEALKEPSNSSVPPNLIMLDTTNSGLFNDLECLDFIPSRDNDTVHIFYVKPGQTTAAEILSNVGCYSNVQPQFVEFLHSLGWPVDVRKHAGWTGHVTTSWKIIEPDDMDEDEYQTGTGGSLYDGRQQVLYWADVLSELALVVPSSETFRLRSLSTSEIGPENKSPPTYRGLGPYSYTDSHLASKPTTLLLEAERSRLTEKESPSSPPEVPPSTTAAPPGGIKYRRLGRQPASMTGPDTKVLVVWLESFEDHDNFPISELLIVTSTGQEQGATSISSSGQRPQEKDIYVIFIHALQNGLFRIHMMEYEKTQSKMSIAIPLVDGMVISRRTLGSMVRQTAINICRRRRLESEYYQPPHVRRKLKIQEMVSKYKCTMSPAEFYTALFQEFPK